MATVQMGAIITKIAGSIGGTNFRRQRATTVISNKTAGGSKNKLRQNKALAQLSRIVQSWSLLQQSVRDAWSIQATNFQFPDKFGNMRNLTGRQLYIKCLNGTRSVGFVDPNVNTLSSNLTAFSPLAVTLFNGTELVITTDTVQSNQIIMVSMEFLKNNAVSPSFKRRKLITWGEMDGSSTMSTELLMSVHFPFAVAGDKFRFYLEPVNTSGFRGQKTFIIGTYNPPIV